MSRRRYRDATAAGGHGAGGGGAGARIVPGDRAGTYLLRMDGMDQSVVDPADPTWLGFEYLRRLGDVVDGLAAAGEPIRAVHIGGGALSLPRYVAATRPRSSQIVLEPDTTQTELVRRELPLPPRSGIRVRGEDGRRGVAALRDASAEVVVLDAFVGTVVPTELTTAAFFADVARALRPHGVLAANLTDAAPFRTARNAVAGMREAFAELALVAETAVLRGRRPGNLVVVAGERVPLAALRAGVARDVSGHRVLDDAGVRDSFGGGTIET